MTALAQQLEAVVRAIPGVVALYSMQPAVVRSAREIVAAAEPLVSVSQQADSLRISVSVGVDAASQAPVTAAGVAAAIRAALPPGTEADVMVRVGRVIP